MASQQSLTAPLRRLRTPGRAALFFGFAFAVMADPVSSVAYAIEAALRALGGHLELLTVTMGFVIGIIALVTLNYWQLVRRFPEGGGLAGGGRTRARRALVVSPDRRPGRRLRVDDRDLDRRRGKGRRQGAPEAVG